MVWHLITYAMMLPWLPMYMIIILEVQKIGIQICQNVTKNLANAVLHIKEVHPGMTYPTKSKNLVHLKVLTHWGRVTHICVSKLTIIGSDNGLSPGRRLAIIWTNTGILLIEPSGTNFNKILIEIHTFSFKKMHLKLSSGKCRPFCLGLNVLSLTIVSTLDRVCPYIYLFLLFSLTSFSFLTWHFFILLTYQWIF